MVKLDIKATIDRVKNDIKGNVLFVNVESRKDYVELRTALNSFDVVKLSSFFSDKTDMPLLPKLEEKLGKTTKSTVVLGLFSFCAFREGEKGVFEQLTKYGRNQSSTVFICYGLEKVLEDFRDIRITQNIISVNSATNVSTPIMTIANTATKDSLDSLKSFFEQLEEKGIHTDKIVSDKIKPSAFDAYWVVRYEKSGFDKLKSQHSFIRKNWGSQEQWDWLLIKKGKLLTIKELKSKIKRWSELDDNGKWLCFISAKEIEDCYLKRATGAADNASDFVASIYNHLLEVDKDDAQFSSFYTERRFYIKSIRSDAHSLAYFRLARAKDDDRVHYLTDLSQTEREDIVEWISENRPSVNILKNVLKTVYPLLYEYLADYIFGNQLVDDYFNGAGYKYYKLLNSIDDIFVAKVDDIAKAKYYGLVDTIHSAVNKLPSKGIGKLWLDALGIEYAAFIKSRAKAHGLKVKISPVRVGLPTTTSQNKDFLLASGFDKKLDDLDDVKHAKAKNAEFEKKTTPIYITKELEIIDGVIKWIAEQIKNGVAKYALVSDHGASRLALVHKNSGKAIAIEKSGDADMRFAPLGVVDHIKYPQLTADENGYHCVTNYDYVKGGKTMGVEAHGGATLEELVVPVAVFEMAQEIKITHSPKKKILKLNRGILEKFILSLSVENQETYIKVDGKISSPVLVKGSIYEFNLPLDKVGEYEATIFVDNQEIGITHIKVESSLAKETDMGI